MMVLSLTILTISLGFKSWGLFFEDSIIEPLMGIFPAEMAFCSGPGSRNHKILV